MTRQPPRRYKELSGGSSLQVYRQASAPRARHSFMRQCKSSLRCSLSSICSGFVPAGAGCGSARAAHQEHPTRRGGGRGPLTTIRCLRQTWTIPSNKKGITVTAVQLPLTSLEHDNAVTCSALAAQTTPTVLDGHSYWVSLYREPREAHFYKLPKVGTR